jgi:hypothetical protein
MQQYGHVPRCVRGTRGAVRACAGIFRHHAPDQRIELRRYVRNDVGQRRRLLEQDLVQHREDLRAFERESPGHALERDATEPEQIGARVDFALSARLLRRHVRRRAEHQAGPRPPGVWLARDCRDGSALAVKLLTKAERKDDSIRFVRVTCETASRSRP